MVRQSAFKRASRDYLEEVRATRAPSTAVCYEKALERLGKAVEGSGVTTYVTRWTVEDVRMVLTRRSHILPNSFRLEAAVLRNLLKFLGMSLMQRAIDSRQIRLPHPVRFHVRWYNESVLASVRAACQGDAEYVAVVLASEVGLRRGEIASLQLQDIQGDVLFVRNSKGGKDKHVPLTASVSSTLEAWLRVRRGLVLKALSCDPSAVVPEEVLIWQKGRIIRPYARVTISGIVRRVGRRVGISLSPHDLRRSCGRELWKATHNLIAVNRLLRHESLDQTREYIGADLEDARLAMEAREALRLPTVPLEAEPVVR